MKGHYVIQNQKKLVHLFGMLTNLWKSSQVKRRLKLHIFKVTSYLHYDLEAGNEAVTLTNKLDVFVNKCLSFILIKVARYN